jgi:hypothetical protein
MSVLAAIRPDDWNLALFTHVLGAFLLIGALLTSMLVLYAGWGSKTASDSLAYARLAFKSLLYVALPAWIIMRVGAGWIYEKEFGDTETDPTWVGIGFIAAEPGALLLLIAIVLGGLSARKLRKDGGTMGTMGKITTVLATLLFVVYLIAVWAMGAKPT